MLGIGVIPARSNEYTLVIKTSILASHGIPGIGTRGVHCSNEKTYHNSIS